MSVVVFCVNIKCNGSERLFLRTSIVSFEILSGHGLACVCQYPAKIKTRGAYDEDSSVGNKREYMRIYIVYFILFYILTFILYLIISVIIVINVINSICLDHFHI